MEFTAAEEHWMQHALTLAKAAAVKGEVPVGAVLVQGDQIIGEGANGSITQCDPSAHAEIIALRKAAHKIGNYRLLDTTLYVTLEPCIMCAGAIVHSRIKKLVYGATDLKAGAIVSKLNTLDQPFLNHRIEYVGGLLGIECGTLLSQFFQARRKASFQT